MLKLTKREQTELLAKAYSIRSQAEFLFGFKDITREEFDRKIEEANILEKSVYERVG